MGLSCGKVIGNILVNVDGITLGLNIGTDLGSLDGSFLGYNDGNLEGLFLKIHWDLLIVKCLAMIKETNCEYWIVKGLALYLEM